jgi:2-iminobutanoate/2-iminopropanoate deaminase
MTSTPVRTSIHIDSFAHKTSIPVATKIGPLLVSSIIPPFNAGTRDLPATVEAQIDNLFLHAGNMLAAAGASWEHVAKMTFFVADISARAKIDAVWTRVFPDPESRASRHTLVVTGEPGGPALTCEFLAWIGD